MKLTDKHLDKFSQYVAKWQTNLGLIGWYLSVKWEKDEETDALAYVRAGAKGRVATVYLCKDWGDHPVTDENLEETAFHELMHIVLADLTSAAEKHAPRSMYNTIQGMEHNVIRTLENLVFRILK